MRRAETSGRRGPDSAPRPPRGLADIAFRLVAMAGVCFWFAVAFPWGPHNEGYDWIVRFDTMAPGAILLHGLPAVVSWRPIGIGLAWLLYRWGGGTGEWVQLANAAFVALAWWRLAGQLAPRRVFAVLGLLAGGALFSGYIFLFHIHGVFYGPLLLYVVELLGAGRREATPGALGRMLALGAACALVHVEEQRPQKTPWMWKRKMYPENSAPPASRHGEHAARRELAREPPPRQGHERRVRQLHPLARRAASPMPMARARRGQAGARRHRVEPHDPA